MPPCRICAPIPSNSNPDSGFKSELKELVIPEDSIAISKKIFELGLPLGGLIVLIGRGNEYILPRGMTSLEQGDTLLILADSEVFRRVYAEINTRRPES